MSPRNSVPNASSRVSDDIATEVVRLDIRGVPHNAIASKMKVHRQTVERVLERASAARRLVHDTSEELQRALDVYRAIQAEAWAVSEEARNRGKLSVSMLGEVRQAQTRMDNLLGLESLREGQNGNGQASLPEAQLLPPEECKKLMLWMGYTEPEDVLAYATTAKHLNDAEVA